MAPQSPLDSGTLRAIDDCLSNGDLPRAQQMLARLDASGEHAGAAAYLATRLLYLRDRLDPSSVVERLRELLQDYPEFPEAEALLGIAAHGVPGPRSIAPPPGAGPSVLPPRPPPSMPPPAMPPGSMPPRAARQITPAPATSPGSLRPTAQPPEGSPPPFTLEDDAPDSDRPTFVPDDGQLPQIHAASVEARKIVVDTRFTPHPKSAGSNATPASVSRGPRSAGRYSWIAPDAQTSVGPRGPAPAPVIPRAPSLPNFDDEARATAATIPGAAAVRVSEPSAEARRASWIPRQSSVPPAQRTLAELSAPHELWPEVEQRLVQGDHAQAAEYFAQAARQQLSHLPQRNQRSEFDLFASNAAECLNKSWVTHHFAPFDLSLHSLARLQIAMATLLGGSPSATPAPAVVLLIGGYIGATLRLAHRGTWVEGADLQQARVRAGSYEWRPFETVRHWLMSGARKSLIDELGTGLAKPGTLAWAAHQRVRITPHTLWHGEVDPERVPLLAAAVQHSVLGYACEVLYEQPLNISFESLDALGRLTDVVTRSSHPLYGQEPWLQRLALFVGSYLGETIRTLRPTAWTRGADGELALGTGVHMHSPMSYIVSRAVTQRPCELVQYAQSAVEASG